MDFRLGLTSSQREIGTFVKGKRRYEGTLYHFYLATTVHCKLLHHR